MCTIEPYLFSSQTLLGSGRVCVYFVAVQAQRSTPPSTYKHVPRIISFLQNVLWCF